MYKLPAVRKDGDLAIGADTPSFGSQFQVASSSACSCSGRSPHHFFEDEKGFDLVMLIRLSITTRSAATVRKNSAEARLKFLYQLQEGYANAERWNRRERAKYGARSCVKGPTRSWICGTNLIAR